jgi:Tol biopolymer transport system component
MPLESGTKLGPYQTLEQIGAGGMGEVHKAIDTRLNRTVAIKVLPPRFSENLEMKQRFEREARTIAALNHPHICTLYDVGQQDNIEFLVMEYLEGETLAQRLSRGPMPLDEALTVAIAIADALDKAHRQGVTHRDLKPGNVMLSSSGAKLLDFGLAKLSLPVQSPRPISGPVTAGDSTAPGLILGTVPYMAPEQLEGKDADARTDIFAFGAVLYEMLTGKRAFAGKSQAVLIASIVSADPEPLSKVLPATPPAVDYIVRRCLAKDADERLQTAWDLVSQLRWIAEGGADAAPNAAFGRRHERWTRLALAGVLLLVAILMFPTVRFLAGSKTPEVTRFLIDVPDMPVPEATAVSPDGRLVAYAARDTGATALFVRPINSIVPQKLAGTEGAGRLFWSPNSKSIAFFAGGQLKRVDAGGGATQNICETADLMGGTWNAEDVIVFASSKGLQRVLAVGGVPSAITPGGASGKEGNPREPYFLPDGRHYLFLSGPAKADGAAIYAGTLDSSEATRLVAANSNPVYAEPGYLLYHNEGTLYAQPFNPKKLSLSGDAVRMADKVPYSTMGGGAFGASNTGVLIYRNTPPSPVSPAVSASASASGASNVTATPLLWVDRSGNKIEERAPEADWIGVDLSPDGKRIAVHRHDTGGGDVFIFEPGLETAAKLTFDVNQDNSSPIWSPDGKRIAFGAHRNGKWGLYLKNADNTRSEVLIKDSESAIVPMSWTPDGNTLVYTITDSRTSSDIWRISLTGEKEAIAFLQTPANERHPQVSPDGKWIAYSSNEAGRSEIYIRSFPEGPTKIQVSENGGVFPRWRHDGKELYFMSLVSFGYMMAVDIGIRGAEIRKEADSHVLFQTGFFNLPHGGGYAHAYAVSADGQRFLIPGLESANASLLGLGGNFRTLPPLVGRGDNAGGFGNRGGPGNRGNRGDSGNRGGASVARVPVRLPAGTVTAFAASAVNNVYNDRHGGTATALGSAAPINLVLNWTATVKK